MANERLLNAKQSSLFLSNYGYSLNPNSTNYKGKTVVSQYLDADAGINAYSFFRVAYSTFTCASSSLYANEPYSINIKYNDTVIAILTQYNIVSSNNSIQFSSFDFQSPCNQGEWMTFTFELYGNSILLGSATFYGFGVFNIDLTAPDSLYFNTVNEFDVHIPLLDYAHISSIYNIGFSASLWETSDPTYATNYSSKGSVFFYYSPTERVDDDYIKQKKQTDVITKIYMCPPKTRELYNENQYIDPTLIHYINRLRAFCSVYGPDGETYTLFNYGSDNYATSIKYPVLWTDTIDPRIIPDIDLQITPNPSSAESIFNRYIVGQTLHVLAKQIKKYGSYDAMFSLTYKGVVQVSTRGYGNNIEYDTDALTANSGNLIVSLTDTRNQTKTITVNCNAVEWFYPEITLFAVHRCKQDGTRDDSGAYCEIEWGVKIAPVDNLNSKSLSIVNPEGTRQITLASYTATGSFIVAASTEYSYNIVMTLADSVVTLTRTIRLSTAGVLMDFLAGGQGLAIGKVAEYTKTLDLAPDWTFLVDNLMIANTDLVQWMQDIERRLTAGNL